jgi:HEPN domain-containing protein
MKRQTKPWVRKAEEDVQAARTLAAASPPLRDIVCFHCQQAVEKYLKAMLQELGVAFPKTHDLELLVDLILPHDATVGHCGGASMP